MTNTDAISATTTPLADVIPLIRALWRQTGPYQYTISLSISGQTVDGRIAEIEAGVWGWEVRAANVGAGDYVDAKYIAMLAVEKQLMSMLRAPKVSGWRVATAKAV